MIPDRIKYTVPGTSHKLLQGAILGTIGYNNKIQENLEVLEKLQAIDLGGPLFRAWLRYAAAAADSQNLSNDAAMMTALNDYQILACVGSSYRELPRRAAKIAKIEELRGGRRCDADQERNRNRQRHQRARFGQHLDEGFWLQHAATCLLLHELATRFQGATKSTLTILTKSGRKRADWNVNKPAIHRGRQERLRNVVKRVTFEANLPPF